MKQSHPLADSPLILRQEALISAGIFVGAIGLYSLTWFHGLHGAGISTVGAERVLRGEIPYRDFWAMYAPGHFYLLALLFRIFGVHLLVDVIAGSVVSAAAAAVGYRLVLNFTGKRFAGLTCATVFLAVMYNTGYFKNLGTYPPAIFFVFMAFNFVVLYYQAGKLSHLVAAGFATGAVVAFKHDVGVYTAMAVVAGLISHFVLLQTTTDRRPTIWLKLVAYGTGIGAIVLPILVYFAVVAGPDMLQDLVVFPLTDFRFARPENYPSIFPFGLYDASRVKMLVNFFEYFTFLAHFALFLLGLVAVALAIRKRKPEYVALGVTFSVGYLLHYGAAHVQINTHIITMSVYAAWLALIFCEVVKRQLFSRRTVISKALISIFLFVWLLSLAATPTPFVRGNRNSTVAELKLAKVSGFRVQASQADNLAELAAFVNGQIPPGRELYVGLHRHDVVVIGSPMTYFFLDRPSATRYHELHPAITDTARVQREIIENLRAKNVSLIVLKNVFPDERLEEAKKRFLRNLPYIGATELDEFIRESYLEVRRFGSYSVWKRKDAGFPIA